FFKSPPTPALYTLSLHDALPISDPGPPVRLPVDAAARPPGVGGRRPAAEGGQSPHGGRDGLYLAEPRRRRPRGDLRRHAAEAEPDRKSTRLNSSHVEISYAVFCL